MNLVARTAAILLVSGASMLGAQEAKPGDRLPAPDAAKQKEAEKTVRELFKTDYAKKPSERQGLAQELLRHARETRDDPAAQWVMYREAQDVAAQCGDYALLAEALDAFVGAFDVPIFPTKLATLTAASKNARTPEELARATDPVLKLVEAALKADDFESADKALAAAQQSAKRANLPALTQKVAGRTKETAEVKARFEKVKRSLDVLAKDPDNGPANLDVGQYLVFSKKNWDEGLPLLTKGSDPGMKVAAVRELAKPSEPDKMVEAGDAWWDLAQKEKADSSKASMTARAISWYEQALPSLNGLPKTKVELRLEAQKKKELAAGLETVFGEKTGSPNLVVVDADDGHFEETTVAGKPCVRLKEATIANSDGTRYLYVHVAQKWKPEWKPVELEMEYYDEGSGSVDVHYDAIAGVYKDGLKSFNLSGSRTWKTFKFTLPEPLFADRLKTGSDFRIHVFPGSALAVHRMALRLILK